MVLRLADVLEVPMRHCNTLMQAAGYVGHYRESALEDPQLDPIRRSIEKLLERQNPFPTIVCDRHFDIKMQNRSALELLALLVDVESIPAQLNAVRFLFSEEGLRPWVVNWPEVGSAMIQRLHREIAVHGADERISAILEEALSTPGIPSQWRFASLEADLPVVVPLHLRKGDVDLRFFTALATLGTALDVTLSELVIETFLPADDDTERRLQELFGD
jgi:hypothetical protein